jgi:NADPH:quinone reductase-like Zn-dependent oxidoreductase
VQTLDLLGLAEGQTLLATGAAGGVGGFAVELAAVRGLRVVAVRPGGSFVAVAAGEPVLLRVRGW